MFGLKNPFPKATETISGILVGKKEGSSDAQAKDTDTDQDKGKDQEKDGDKEKDKEKKAKESAAAAAKAKSAGARSSSSKTSSSAETYEQYLIGCVSPLIIIMMMLMNRWIVMPDTWHLQSKASHRPSTLDP